MLLQFERTGKTSGKLSSCSSTYGCCCCKGPQGAAWTVASTAEALGVYARTIEHLKRRVAEQGLEAALCHKPWLRKPRAVTFDGKFAARLTALSCPPVPEGRTRWTGRPLAGNAVELGLAPRVSPMTVRRILRRTICVLI